MSEPFCMYQAASSSIELVRSACAFTLEALPSYRLQTVNLIGTGLGNFENKSLLNILGHPWVMIPELFRARGTENPI